MSPLHLPRASFFEALGRAFVRFQFRHSSSIRFLASAASRCQPSVLDIHFQFLWIVGATLADYRSTKPAKPDLEPRQRQPASRFLAPSSPEPAFPVSLSPVPAFPAPAFSPASPSAWLLFLFPSPARPPFSSAPGWRAACCL